jgi:hypothetical protein
VVDSSKGPAFTVILAHVPVEGVVVHLVRDSRAVAHSWSRVRAMPEVDGASFMAQHLPMRAAFDWTRSNLAVDSARAAGIASTRIQYERLVRGDSAELALLGAALGLVASELALICGPAVTVGVQHTVAGNPARFSGGEVHLRPDEEWMSAMRQRDRRLVEALTLPLLAAYGYPLRG